MRKAVVVFLVSLVSVLALGIGGASAYNAGQFCKKTDLGKIITAGNGRLIRCELVNGYDRWVYYTPAAPPTYTARYTSEQYAAVARAANFYHLHVQDVPETGVHVLAFLLKLGPHASQRPLAKPANNGPDAISTAYSTATMQADMTSASHYIALDGNGTLYVGGLLLAYFAALGGAK